MKEMGSLSERALRAIREIAAATSQSHSKVIEEALIYYRDHRVSSQESTLSHGQPES